MTPGPNFDWVDARSRCQLGSVFEQLRQQVHTDIQKRNAQRDPKNTWYEFALVNGEPASSNFMAMISGNAVDQRVVWFKLTPQCIAIHKDGNTVPAYEAYVTLSNDGQCRLRIKDQEYEFWQVRRMALEDLLFRSVRTE